MDNRNKEDKKEQKRKMPKNDNANDKKLKTRYEVKGERQAGATRAKLVSQVNAFLQALVAKPSMWMDPLLEEVRKCVGRILSDPCAFPPALPQASNTKQAQARRPSMDSSSSLPLTPGVAQALYDRQELGNGMVVQITNGSKKSVKNTALAPLRGAKSHNEKTFYFLFLKSRIYL
jgi:hypothetical protein